MPEPRVAVPGTEHPARPDARAIGPADPNELVEASVLARPRAPLGSLDERLAHGDPPLSREEFAAQYGASADDLRAIEAFARARGLEVVQADAARRTVLLRGTARAIGDAFGVQLQRYASPGGATFRAHDGPVYVPPELDGVVQAVFGLDTRPAARRG